MAQGGKLIISLDFELFWGVRDLQTIEGYGKHILSVQNTLPRLLDLFNAYDVKGTFATVGFLFASNKEELLSYCPKNKPQYLDKDLSPYNGHFDKIEEDESDDKYHYASQLIDKIKQYPDQEIATHTFSHYYCLEKGQTIEDFREDIQAAISIANNKDIKLNSLVFPRNQFNEAYTDAIYDLGITSYRGNEEVWFYNAAKTDDGDKWYRKGLRLLDSYVNISGHNCYSLDDMASNKPFNIPSSRFLRPFNSKLRSFEKLKVKRILNSMTYAAKNKKVYHLWWHPHNFGVHEDENFTMLTKILSHYKWLNETYGFESITMKGLTEELEAE